MPEREEDAAGTRAGSTTEEPASSGWPVTQDGSTPGALEGVAGETFEIGRPINGETVFEITADPTRPDVEALRVLMGPFTIYTPENVEAAAG